MHAVSSNVNCWPFVYLLLPGEAWNLGYTVMTNSTEADGRTGSGKGGTIVVAIIVPSILILVLLVLIFMSVLKLVRFFL